MSVFSATVSDFWQSWFCAPQGGPGDGGFSLQVNPQLDPESRLMLLMTASGTQAVLTPALALVLGLDESPVAGESEFRLRLEHAGIALHGADHLFYLPQERHAALLRELPLAAIRALSASDEAPFARFQSCASEQDLDNAYVELDHWAVFGAFVGDQLVSAASMYPWEDGPLADLGVLTLESFRGRGHACRLVRAICRHALEQGQEPQYRCQTDNLASQALARAVGLELFGQWQVISPDCEI